MWTKPYIISDDTTLDIQALTVLSKAYNLPPPLSTKNYCFIWLLLATFGSFDQFNKTPGLLLSTDSGISQLTLFQKSNLDVNTLHSWWCSSSQAFSYVILEESQRLASVTKLQRANCDPAFLMSYSYSQAVSLSPVPYFSLSWGLPVAPCL